MIYMFLSNIPSSGDINSSNLPCRLKFCKRKLFERAEKSKGLFCRLEILACDHASV